jgi:hypothetical protein
LRSYIDSCEPLGINNRREGVKTIGFAVVAEVVGMKRLFVALICLMICTCLFADTWVRVELYDEFGDATGASYLMLAEDKTGTYKGKDTNGSFSWNMRIDNDDGEIFFKIKEDGQDKNVTTTSGSTTSVDKTTKYKVSFRADDGTKYSFDGGSVEISFTYALNRLQFVQDFRNYLTAHDWFDIVITSDYGSYSLGRVDFSGIDSMLDDVVYQVGDIGPAGGYIFYDCDADNSSGNADGLTSFTCGWRYLEAAASDLGGACFGYYRPEKTNLKIGTGTAIGTGKSNTKCLVKAMGTITYTKSSGSLTDTYAAKMCDDYSVTYHGVVYDDWFLPSKDELNLLYEVLQLNGLGDFSKNAYWSSSEYNQNNAWLQYFYSGYDYCYVRSNRHSIRAIRSF